ncbi:hypothetical protein BD769DRAFT_1416504 [Suillus cothurnatus]|nr:hypothetical protein BD769DRAFT_1416504 [Suillus cothurnatus]
MTLSSFRMSILALSYILNLKTPQLSSCRLDTWLHRSSRTTVMKSLFIKSYLMLHMATGWITKSSSSSARLNSNAGSLG